MGFDAEPVGNGRRGKKRAEEKTLSLDSFQ
jgi:hypothetical protein